MNAWTLNAIAKIEQMHSFRAFTAEDLRKRMKEPPPHPSCVGNAFREAARRGFIHKVDVQKAKRNEAAGHLLRVWVRM